MVSWLKAQARTSRNGVEVVGAWLEPPASGARPRRLAPSPQCHLCYPDDNSTGFYTLPTPTNFVDYVAFRDNGRIRTSADRNATERIGESIVPDRDFFPRFARFLPLFATRRHELSGLVLRHHVLFFQLSSCFLLLSRSVISGFFWLC